MFVARQGVGLGRADQEGGESSEEASDKSWLGLPDVEGPGDESGGMEGASGGSEALDEGGRDGPGARRSSDDWENQILSALPSKRVLCLAVSLSLSVCLSLFVP
jgi:hypothetical protein